MTSGSSRAEGQFGGGRPRTACDIEAASIQHDGHRRQVLEMLNLKTPDSQGHRAYRM